MFCQHHNHLSFPFPTDIFPPSYEPFVDNDFNPTAYVTIGENQFPSTEVLFVYEKLDRNHSLSTTTLESEERFCDRWMKANKLYVLQQGPYQFGVAKHLQHPHYQLHAQVLYDRVCHFEKTNHDKLNVQSINDSQSFSDDFMYVTNLHHDDKFPWALIGTALDVYCNSDKSNGDPLDGRQRTFVDFGYCSHQSTKRDAIGIACANKLVGTNSAIARALFSNTHILIDACKDATFTSGFGRDSRRTHFASELGDGNLFETIRCHETSSDALCNIHTDNHNGKEDGYTLVYWCSRLECGDGWRRQGMVAYTRYSIETYLDDRQDNEQYLLDAKKAISQVDKWRTKLTKQTLDEADVVMHQYDGINMKQVRCNFQTECFYQPYLYIICRLAKHYQLSHRQTVGLLVAIATHSPHCAFFPTIAAELTIATVPFVKGNKVPWIFQDIIAKIKVHVKVTEKGKERSPRLRFGKYDKMESFDKVRWRTMVDTSVMVLGRFQKNPTSERYLELCNQMQFLENVGPLIVHHMMGLASILGLLPLGFFEFKYQHPTHVLKDYKSRYGSNLPTADEMFRRLRLCCKSILMYHPTERSGENIWCKIGRLLPGKNGKKRAVDAQFADMIVPDFPLLVVQPDGIWNVESCVCVGQSLLHIKEDRSVVINPRLRMTDNHSRKHPWMEEILARSGVHYLSINDDL